MRLRNVSLLPLVLALGVGPGARSASALKVTLADGLKMETVASNLRAPRAVLQVGDDVFVVEFGGWGAKIGALVRLRKTGGAWQKATLVRKLNQPVGLAQGPDGKVYLGEVGMIDRFDPKADTVTLEKVISDIPAKGLHPLTSFAFTKEGDLIVNLGSTTDNCEKFKGRPLCPEAEGVAAHAVLRRYKMHWPDGNPTGWTVEARGLRNSMGLVVHPSGTILEADNGRDAINDADPSLSDATLPHDELNLIATGKNFGWPYCFDARRNSPEFRTYDCSKTTAPIVLLPAHAAPLGMAYWGDQLVVGYHGYRDTGHRLVAFPVDANGLPAGAGVELITGWGEAGDQLAGGPVGISVAADGALWVTDDRNNVVLRLTRTNRDVQK